VDAGVTAQALQKGAVAFFRKPFSDVEFLDAVGRAMK